MMASLCSWQCSRQMKLGFKCYFCTFFSSNFGSCPLDQKKKKKIFLWWSAFIQFVPCVCFLCQEAWQGEGAACRGGHLQPRPRNGLSSHLVTVPRASPKSFIRNSKLWKPKVVFITNFMGILDPNWLESRFLPGSMAFPAETFLHVISGGAGGAALLVCCTVCGLCTMLSF